MKAAQLALELLSTFSVFHSDRERKGHMIGNNGF